MSGKAVGWVLRNGPKQKAMRQVLAAIADTANVRGEGSRIRVDDIAERTCYERRQVYRALGALIEDGWIEREKDGGGRGRVPVYRLNYDLERVTSRTRLTPERVTSTTRKGDFCDTERVTSAHERVTSATADTPSDLPKRAPTVLDGKDTVLERCRPSSEAVKTSPHLVEAERLCALMAEMLEARGYHVNGQARSRGWVESMERLLRIDGRRPGEVEWVLRWLDDAADDVAAFWRTNVRSPNKLREKWVVMGEQYERSKGRSETQAAGVLTRFAERNGLL